MHFHDSFIAHFFPVLSLSCCHKQTSAVLLLFIIHKSNKVASQDGARRHFRDVLHHSFLLLRPLSISISSFVSRIRLTASSLPRFSPICHRGGCAGCEKIEKSPRSLSVASLYALTQKPPTKRDKTQWSNITTIVHYRRRKIRTRSTSTSITKRRLAAVACD